MPRPHGIPDAQWRDWVWQMQERVLSAKELERYVNPTDDERRAIDALAERFRFVITPYYASLMDRSAPSGGRWCRARPSWTIRPAWPTRSTRWPTRR
jgi:L-lysine 2,3-aminomutase